MVIDTSALIAILRQEDEAQSFALAIKNDPVRLMSAVSVLEAAMVMESQRGRAAGGDSPHRLAKVRPGPASSGAQLR